LGYRAEEDALFGVDPKGRIGRLTHAVDVTRRLMRGEEVSAQGDGTEQVGVRLPLEHAGISMPIWFGGFAPPAIQRAARLGDGYLIGSGDYARICSLLDVLDSTPPVSETFEVAVQQYVIPSDSGIDPAIILRGLEYQQAVYGTWSGPSSPAVVSGTTDEIVDSLMPLLERLNRYARVHYVFRSLVPGLTSAESCELALWLGTEVVPRLKAASGVAP
jgi:alkanesulfonate monooxygenase SsuD/methylene tetrahydromethanopterin reductase-like flavin-dependent oxidoreductase (luciferase family)